MFEEQKAELIKFILKNMFSKEQTNSLLDYLEIKVPSSIRNLNKNQFIDSLEKINQEITLGGINKYARSKWRKPPIDKHIKNLESGVLKEHGWYGTMPSTLHLSLQAMIRDYANSEKSSKTINDLIKTGSDIMKHEYFIVAVADICENIFIEKFEDAIPSIASRGVIDFIFGDIPYDLKNSVIPNGWTFERANNTPKTFIEFLVAGADVERMRKQAEGMHKNWGNNRLYVIAEYEDIWLDKPKKALEYLFHKATTIKNDSPFKIEISNGLTLLAKIIFIPKNL